MPPTGDATNLVKDLTSKHKVLVFSKSTCPYCTKVRIANCLNFNQFTVGLLCPCFFVNANITVRFRCSRLYFKEAATKQSQTVNVMLNNTITPIISEVLLEA